MHAVLQPLCRVLMAFKHGPHHWVVAMANMMVVVHVAAAYQVRDSLLLLGIDTRRMTTVCTSRLHPSCVWVCVHMPCVCCHA